MTKDVISKAYMDKQKKEHAWKKYPSIRNIAIIGGDKEDSIGEEIFKKCTHSQRLSIDVTYEFPNFNGYTDLIMCHGYTYMDWLENIDDDQTSEILKVNLLGSIRMIQQFVQQTIDKSYRKKIISIGSMAYRNVLNGSSIYCAAKSGLNMFIRCAAWELAPKGYDVYIIHPSNVVGTPMTKETINHLMNYRELTEEQATEYWSANNPRESFLTKEEIANHVHYILFNDTSYLAGCPIELGGGQR